MKLHMFALGLALRMGFIEKWYVFSATVPLGSYKRSNVFSLMWSWILFNNTSDGWSIGMEVPHMCTYPGYPAGAC